MLITIVNLFFIPMISIYIFYKNAGKEIKISTEFVSLYVIFVAVVSVISHILTAVISYLFNGEFTDVTSKKYMLVAVLVSVILPLILQNISLKKKGVNNEEK